MIGRGVFRRETRQPLLAFASGMILVLAIGSVVWVLSQSGGEADPTNTAQVAQGQQVYAASCASCHGAKLEGQPNWKERLPSGLLPAPPHDASGHTWHHPDQLLFEIVAGGSAVYLPPGEQGGMPAFGGVLSDAEIWAVLAYIKSTWPAETRAAQEQVNQQAR